MSDTKDPRTVVKDVGKARLYSDGTIAILGLRVSYPHVFKPYKNKDGTPGKFGMVGLMPKTKEYFPAKDLIRDHIRQMIRDAKLKDLPADKKFLRDGDTSGREHYDGMYEIHANEERRPQIRDSRRDPKTKKPAVLKAGEDDDRIYGGCWVNILVRPWYQDNEWGKRINAGLVVVQFVRDDEAFGQGRITDEDVDNTFDEFADDGDSGFDDELGDDEEL